MAIMAKEWYKGRWKAQGSPSTGCRKRETKGQRKWSSWLRFSGAILLGYLLQGGQIGRFTEDSNEGTPTIQQACSPGCPQGPLGEEAERRLEYGPETAQCQAQIATKAGQIASSQREKSLELGTVQRIHEGTLWQRENTLRDGARGIGDGHQGDPALARQDDRSGCHGPGDPRGGDGRVQPPPRERQETGDYRKDRDGEQVPTADHGTTGRDDQTSASGSSNVGQTNGRHAGTDGLFRCCTPSTYVADTSEGITYEYRNARLDTGTTSQVALLQAGPGTVWKAAQESCYSNTALQQGDQGGEECWHNGSDQSRKDGWEGRCRMTTHLRSENLQLPEEQESNGLQAYMMTGTKMHSACEKCGRQTNDINYQESGQCWLHGIMSLIINGMKNRWTYHGWQLIWVFSCISSVQASYSEETLENLAARGSFFDWPMGAVGAPPQWHQPRWDWVTRVAGLRQPEDDERWQIFRTVSPFVHNPDRWTFWIADNTDAVEALRRIEAHWGDLPAYNGVNIFWNAIAINPSILQSHSVDQADWHAIVTSQNDEANMGGYAPVYVDRREGLPGVQVDTGQAMFVPFITTVPSLLQWLELLPRCITHFDCKIFVNGVLETEAIILRSGSYVRVEIIPNELRAISEDENSIECPEPIAQPRPDVSPTSACSSDDVSIHTPTYCGPLDANQAYHIYRPLCYPGHVADVIFADTHIRSDMTTELVETWPDLRTKDWEIVEVNPSYEADHPTDLSRTVQMVRVPDDHPNNPRTVGIVIFYMYLHMRSTRAYPMRTPLTLERLWQWARIELQCREGSAWKCNAHINDERLQPGDARELHPGDYLRLVVEQAREKGPRGETLPIAQDEKDFTRENLAITGHNKWPSLDQGSIYPPIPSSSRKREREDHAAYWIYIASIMQVATIILLKTTVNKKSYTRAYKRQQRRIGRGHVKGRRLFLTYLLLSGHVGDAVQTRISQLAEPPEWTPQSTTTLTQMIGYEPTGVTTFDRLPPPGNPGLQWTDKGRQMAHDLVTYCEFKERSNQIWMKLYANNGGVTNTLLTPMKPNEATIDFEKTPQDGNSDIEHGHVTNAGSPILPIAESTKTRISLSDALQGQDDDQCRAEHHLDEHARLSELFSQLRTPWTTTPPVDIGILPDLHDSIGRKLQKPQQEIASVTDVSIYTDGSHSRHHVGETATTWAFAVCYEDDKNELLLLEWYAAPITCEALDTHWVGASQDQIREGEATALIWALLWLNAHPHLSRANIFSDATSILWAGTGHWKVHLEDIIAMRLRATAKLTETLWKGKSLQYHHVRAHSGNPGNELADTLAVRVRDGTLDARHPTRCYPKWFHGERPLIYDAWTYWDRLQRPQELPPGLGLDILPSQPNWSAQMPPWIQPPSDTHENDTTNLRCVTYNVHTLKLQGAVGALRQQAEEFGIHLMGLQETRTKSEVVVDTNYIRIVGAAEGGQGGVELWITTKIPLKTHTDVHYFTRQDALVLHADPHLLVVSLNILGTKTICLVGHAPHRGHDNVDIRDWWKKCNQVLSPYKTGFKHLLFLDANANLDRFSPFTGDVGAISWDEGGQGFLAVCQNLDLAIPSTFHHIHYGDSATMFSPMVTHSGTRNDYIGVSRELLDMCSCSWVETSLDAGHAKIDHAALCLDLTWPTARYRQKTRKRYYDRTKIALATREQWTTFFHDWPTIPWHVDVTTHTHYIENFLQQQLAKHFPKERGMKRLSCLSRSTYDILEQRNNLRRLISRSKVTVEVWMMKWAWNRWTRIDDTPVQWKQLLAIMRTVERLHRYKRLTAKLQDQIRLDRDQWLTDRMAIIEATPTKELHRMLQPLRLGKRVRHLGKHSLPQVETLDGTLVADHEEAAKRWREHFSLMEGGQETTDEQLWRDTIACQNHDTPKPPSFLELPTIYELEYFFKQSKAGKATGHDDLPGELLKYAAPELAYRLWPLMTKLGAWTIEPLQWKGGRLITAYKQKGSASSCQSYRALLVSSSLGKSFHNVWRRKVVPYVYQGATPLQFTAQRNALVTQASHCARLYLQQAAYYGRSCFLIFLDIQSAYYQLIRQHAMNLTFSDTDIYTFLQRMGIEPMHIDELAEILQRPSVLEESNCPQHLHAMMSEMHRDTWWTLDRDNSGTIIQTAKGTRPGDGFADILWSLCFSKYLQRINQCLRDLDICKDLPWNGEIGMMSEQGKEKVHGGAIVWADDAVFAADHPDANKIIPMLQTATEIMIEELHRMGMTPNMSKGKTEAMLMVKGRKSRQIRRYIHCHLQGQLPITVSGDATGHLRVVPRYTHLGGLLTHDGRVKQEIKRRLAIAADTLMPYRTKIFKNRNINLDKRIKIFRSTAMAALTYNIGTWPELTKAETKIWCGGVIRLYKQTLQRLVPTRDQFHLTNDKVLAMTGLPDPAFLLHLHRVRQFGRYLQRDGDYFWALLGQDQCWLNTVHTGIERILDQVEGLTILPRISDEDTINHWQTTWRQTPYKINGVLKRAERHHTGQKQLHAEVEDFHKQMLQIMERMGLNTLAQEDEKTTAGHFCYMCNNHWSTYRAWAVHAFKKHGRLSKFRRLQQGVTCAACGTKFPTHARLCRHFRTVTACANTLAADQRWVAAGLMTGNAEADKLDAATAMIPSMPTDEEKLPQRHGWTMTWETRQILALFSAKDWNGNVEPDTNDIGEAIHNTPIHFDEIKDIVDAQKHYYNTELANKRLDEYLRTYWEKGNQEEAPRAEKESTNRADWISRYEELHFRPCDPLPRQPSRFMYVVHLFAGIKRKGDLHSCLEAIPSPPGHVLLPISLDVMLDSKKGNLLEETNQRFWLAAAMDGRLFAVVGGPPCESWSIARYRYLREGTGPRPVRSTDCLMTQIWGMAVLKIKELKQVLTGNRLLQFAILMMTAQAATGGLGFLEHPAAPPLQKEGLPPSIWRLPIVRLLLRHKSASLLHMKQGYYGAKSPKPTTIMVISAPHLRKALHCIIHQGRSQNFLPPPLRMEKTKDGYATMPLKRYPVAMCQALASAIAHAREEFAPNSTDLDGISEVALHFKDAYETKTVGVVDGQDYFCTD